MTQLLQKAWPLAAARGRVVRVLVLLALACWGNLAGAQTAPTPEQYRNVDSHGVDLVTGTFNITKNEGDIGPAGGGVSLIRYWGQSGWRDNWSGDLRRTVEGSTQVITITFGGVAERFTLVGSSWIAARGNGATLTVQSQDSIWQYVSANGTKITYTSPLTIIPPDYPTTISMPAAFCGSGNALACGVPTQIVSPAGQSFALTWHTPQQCRIGRATPTEPDPITTCTATYRLTDVRSASGYAMKIKYASNQNFTGSPGDQSTPPTGWFARTSYKFIDLSQAYCDPNAYDCDMIPGSWPTISYAYPSTNILVVSDLLGNTWQYTQTGPRITGIRRPGSATDTTTIAYDSAGRVSSITEDGATTTYNYTPGATATVVATDVGAGGGSMTVTSSPTVGQPASVMNATNASVTYSYDASNRVIRETRPEGDYTNYVRDARGNITETRIVAKPGSGLADIVSTAGYDATCANPLTCNQPNYVIDPRGNRTDYSYDPVHGQVTRVQLPAPSAGAPRPEVNYTYSALYAQIMTASGTMTNAAEVQYKVTEIRSCATAATCPGSAGETRVTIAYNSPNLLPTAVTNSAGDGSVSATTTYAYDAHDNLVTTDGPLPGSDDTTTVVYDSLDRRRGIIGPDPDGSGPRARVAERYSFDPAGRVIKVERGTVAAATSAALDAMSALQTLDILFDANGNKVRETASAGGATTNIVQYSYDAQNRLTCTALRLNPATWGSLPADACTATTAGPDGPDRITRNSFDGNDRIILVETAVGTSAVSNEVATAYTLNGQTAWVTDGEGNRTTYIYDGFDRLSQTRYPVTTAGSNSSSTSDYEQLSYDAASNVTQRRLRDGQVIGFAYDALGRVTGKDLPGSEPDISFAYDLFGRATAVTSSAGASVSASYDALGRAVSQSSPLGSYQMSYDAAGRQTRLTHPDGFFVTYDYDVPGNVTAIRENGAASGAGVLASYSYDSLGRRSGVTFGNGTSQSFGYDAASRLTSLSSDLAGTARDQSVTFGYNPANQIATTTRSNDAYAWREAYSLDRLYSVDGLNRFLAAGGVNFGYDARGNLTSSGTLSYGYSAENRLVSAPGVTLGYDPVGRLAQVTASGGNMDRPAMKRLLEDIRQGRVDIVVVYKVDRLTRSLMDFARIVETFDSNSVSFVSVTQAFNTTNSMGRLTLNVLLSFAQFEREVTGERIRDKIAASRAKGMFMGGNVPLGYDLGDRRLEVNTQEAERVQHIFTRYVALRSIPALAKELAADGIRSKRWVSRNGRVHGDLPFTCGALSHLLNNRVYRGEAVHKGKAYPGEHEAIVDSDLYQAAQAVLAANRHRKATRKTRAASSPLTEKLYDSDGLPMRMTFSYGRGKLMYRYYVSECLTANGSIVRTDNQQGTRLPATRLERAVTHQLAPLSASDPDALFEAISRATLSKDRLLIEIDTTALATNSSSADILLARAQTIDPAAKIDDQTLTLSIAIPPPRKGRTLSNPDTAMLGGDTRAELAALIRTAHQRLAEIDASPQLPDTHSDMKAPASEWIRKRIAIGLLVPDVQKALLAGTAPAHVTAEWVLAQDWPLDWQAQRGLMVRGG